MVFQIILCCFKEFCHFREVLKSIFCNLFQRLRVHSQLSCHCLHWQLLPCHAWTILHEKEQTPSSSGHPTRISHKNSHPLVYRQIHTRVNYYKYSFYPLAIVQWNRLPSKIALLPTLESFKRAVCCMHDQPPNALNASALFLSFTYSLSACLLTLNILTLSSDIHFH